MGLVGSMVMVVVGGLSLAVAGLMTWAMGRTLRTESVDAGTMPHSGRVMIHGTVEAAAETLVAPSGQECVAFEFDANEHGAADPEVNRDEGNTIASGQASVPFYLNDGTGRVIVDDTPRNDDLSESRADYMTAAYDFGSGTQVERIAPSFDGPMESTKLTDSLAGGGSVDVDQVNQELDRVFEHRVDVDEELTVQGTAVGSHPEFGEPAVVATSGIEFTKGERGGVLGKAFLAFNALWFGLLMLWLGVTGLS